MCKIAVFGGVLAKWLILMSPHCTTVRSRIFEIRDGWLRFRTSALAFELKESAGPMAQPRWRFRIESPRTIGLQSCRPAFRSVWIFRSDCDPPHFASSERRTNRVLGGWSKIADSRSRLGVNVNVRHSFALMRGGLLLKETTNRTRQEFEELVEFLQWHSTTSSSPMWPEVIFPFASIQWAIDRLTAENKSCWIRNGFSCHQHSFVAIELSSACLNGWSSADHAKMAAEKLFLCFRKFYSKPLSE